MNEDRHLTSAGANLIKHFEGCLHPEGKNFKPYACPAGVLTIGWGHTNHHGKKFDTATRWTLTQCDEAFLEDMEGFEKAVRRLVTTPLTDFQFDALTSFTYNVGEGALAKSTLLKCVNAKEFEQAAKEFNKWVKAGGKTMPGLVRRRASESLLFQNVKDANYDGKPDKVVEAPEAPSVQLVDPPDTASAGPEKEGG
jgi:lysozyme